MTDDLKAFASELREDLSVLDLHGLFPDEIEIRIDQFLYENINKKETAVKIIFGVGTGKLHDSALEFLEKHPLVEKTIDKGGNCVVLLFAGNES